MNIEQDKLPNSSPPMETPDGETSSTTVNDKLGGSIQPGQVYWITGLSGSGKSTIGQQLHYRLRKNDVPVVFLDGDNLRQVFGGDLGHSVADRRLVCMRNARICKLLSDQGIHVICATICLLDEVQNWSRENIPFYREILLQAPMEVLSSRKDIYRRAARGEACNVVGVDLPANFPKAPHIVIENDGRNTPCEVVDLLISELSLTCPPSRPPVGGKASGRT